MMCSPHVCTDAIHYIWKVKMSTVKVEHIAQARKQCVCVSVCMYVTATYQLLILNFNIVATNCFLTLSYDKGLATLPVRSPKKIEYISPKKVLYGLKRKRLLTINY